MPTLNALQHEVRVQLARAEMTVDPELRRRIADQAIYTLLGGVGHAPIAEEWREIKAFPGPRPRPSLADEGEKV